MSTDKIAMYQSIISKSYIFDNVQKTMNNLNIDSVFNRLEIDENSELKWIAYDLSDEVCYLILHI